MANGRGRYALLAHPDDRRHVAEALGHLRAFDVQEGAVAPPARKWLSGRRLGLRDLVLVMRKDEVDRAAVDVERLAEQIHRHGRALEMPAGASSAPRRVPGSRGRFVFGLRGLPEREVLRVFLCVLVLGDARAGPHLTLVETREPSI